MSTTPAALLRQLRSYADDLTVESGEICYYAMTPVPGALIAQIKAQKPAIIALLLSEAEPAPPPPPPPVAPTRARNGPPMPKGEPVSGYSFHGTAATVPVTAQPEASAPVVPPRPDHDKARALFAAWDMHVGYAPMSVAGLVAYAAKHPGLEAALRTAVGSLDLDRVAAYLPTLAGLTINDHQIVRDGESAWRLASMWSVNLTATQARTREMFETREDPA